MIRLSVDGDELMVDSDTGDLAPNNESQLAFWQFSSDGDGRWRVAVASDVAQFATKVFGYLEKHDLDFSIAPPLQEAIEKNKLEQQVLKVSRLHGEELKNGNLENVVASEFRVFLEKHIPRKLKDHQFKSALHLLLVKNGANFSVPGSGKTTVVLSVFHMLRMQKVVDALFVVGPPSCFGPWRDEYEETLGIKPTFEQLAGGNIEDRHSKYLTNIESVCDLYLTSFQTLHRDHEQVQILFGHQDIRFFYVIDEAHYVKQPDGAWATAALQISRFAKRRCILTGTPFPHSYSDAFSLFDILWPEAAPISPKDKIRITQYTKQHEYDNAADVLQESIGPLFYRVRKSDLRLASQVFHEPTVVKMNDLERQVYDSILDKIQIASQSDYLRDLDLRIRLRRGRMIRLRQCVSYTKLLTSALDGYDESLYDGDLSLENIIRSYDDLETPGKLEELVKIVDDLRSRGDKVVIWSNFVRTLELIRDTLEGLGHGVHLIYGATPLERSGDTDIGVAVTREQRIREFLNRESGKNVLVANPAACAESVSLHKTCSSAVYYDLSYNCAQYLQSLDRIHRVGGSENKESYYHFLQYQDTIDQDILENLEGKADRMNRVVDLDYPIYSLDMFDQDDDVASYDRIFGNDP